MTILQILALHTRGDVAALRSIVTGQRTRLAAIVERDAHYRAARLADPLTQLAPSGDRAAHLAAAAAASVRVHRAPPGSRALRRAAERALGKVERRAAK